MQANCSVRDCERLAISRTWCMPHYKKWWRWGSPTGRTVDQRFFSHVTEQADGCWLWEHTDPAGYGTYFKPNGNGSHVLPHRWVYEYLRAEIPPGLVIDHLCGIRACVNPWHLEPVTQQVNVQRANAARHPPP